MHAFLGVFNSVTFDIDQNGRFGVADLIMVCVFITALAGAFTVVWKVVAFLRQQSRERFAHAVKGQLSPLIEEIRLQLVPNGGGSLRDALDRAAHQAGSNGEKLQEHIEWTRRNAEETRGMLIARSPEEAAALRLQLAPHDPEPKEKP